MTEEGGAGTSRSSERSTLIETDEAEASETIGLRWDLTPDENLMLADLIVSSLRNFGRPRKEPSVPNGGRETKMD